MTADVTARRLFWASPQGDTVLLAALRARQDGKTCTVRVPTANGLPLTAERLIDAVGRVETLLASRRLIEIPVSDFAASVKGGLDTAVLSQALRDKSECLDLQHADERATAGDFGTARTIVRGVISSGKPSIGVKFFALLVGEKVETLAQARAGAPQAFRSRVELATAIAMQDLTRRGPRHLKLYALLARSAAEFTFWRCGTLACTKTGRFTSTTVCVVAGRTDFRACRTIAPHDAEVQPVCAPYALRCRAILPGRSASGVPPNKSGGLDLHCSAGT